MHVLTGAVLPILAQLRSLEHSVQSQGAADVTKLAESNEQGKDAVVSAGRWSQQTFCLTLWIRACDQALQLNIMECVRIMHI